MKKTLYTPLLTAALLLAASCANDPAEEILNPSVPGTHLPGDTFIIDYAASTGEADTRGLSAAERIQSLDYLVYQSTDGGTTYTLLKRRAIPDINTHTTWPLTRKTMTWAQREALKDTLNTSCMYKMVFVANAADWIWDSENDTPPSNDALKNSSDKVLQHANLPTDGTEAPKFEDGRLILPPRVFTEKDMYYMWSNHDAPVNGADFTNGDKIHYMDITLKRMINKVEVKLSSNLITSGNVEENVIKYLDEYLETALKEEGVLFEDLQTTMESISKDLNIEIYIQANKNLKSYIKNKVQINRILGNTDPKDEQNIRDNFTSEFKNIMINTELVIKKLKWNEIDGINITYQQGGYASQLNFSKKSIASESNNDPLTYSMDKVNNSFIFYTFGKNEINDDLNKFSTFSFKSKNENSAEYTEAFNLSGTGITFTSLKEDEAIQGNHWMEIICDPFNSITDDKTGSYNITLDYSEFLADDWDKLIVGGYEEDVKKNILKALEDYTTFSLTYPHNPFIKWTISVK